MLPTFEEGVRRVIIEVESVRATLRPRSKQEGARRALIAGLIPVGMRTPLRIGLGPYVSVASLARLSASTRVSALIAPIALVDFSHGHAVGVSGLRVALGVLPMLLARKVSPVRITPPITRGVLKLRQKA